MKMAIPSTEVLGYFQLVRSADEIEGSAAPRAPRTKAATSRRTPKASPKLQPERSRAAQ